MTKDDCGLPDCEGTLQCAEPGCEVRHANACSTDKSEAGWRCSQHTTKLTKDEFIDGYCQRSGRTRETFDLFGEAVECFCGEEGCLGWFYKTQPDPGAAFPDTGHPAHHRINVSPELLAGELRIQGLTWAVDVNGREIVCFKPDGTIEMGEGYTPTLAAEAFIAALRDILPSKAENDRLQAKIDHAEQELRRIINDDEGRDLAALVEAVQLDINCEHERAESAEFSLRELRAKSS